MTRIVSGDHRGRRLAVPAGSTTRPTTDRVREALFSSLQSILAGSSGLRGAVVLDLFAGSGGLGLEAASRGAERVVLVERDRRALRTLRENVAVLGEEERATVVPREVLAALEAGPDAPGLRLGSSVVDVALLDPPYDLSDRRLDLVLRAMVEHGWLRQGAVVVVERDARSPTTPWPRGIEAIQHRRYGETLLWYGRAAPADRSVDPGADPSSTEG